MHFRCVLLARLKKFLPLSFVLLLAGRLVAAESADYLIDLWTSDNDLPDSSVTAITQTPDGYLWIGTYNGLVRFDGVRFVTFDPLNTPELKHARIVALFTDARGTLWINTYDGSLLSLRNGVFTREWQGRARCPRCFANQTRFFFATLTGAVIFRAENSGTPENWQVLDLNSRITGSLFRQDAGGTLWYLQRDGIVGRILGTNAASLPDHSGLDGEKVNYLATDRDGQVWVGTEKKIARWNGNFFADETPANGEPAVNTTLLLCADEKNFWAFANGKVRHAADGRWVATTDSWSELLQTDSIYIGAYHARDGGAWIRGLGQGLFHADADGRTGKISAANGLPGNRVNCWFEDREGNIWAGVERGGLVRLRKKQFQILDANAAAATVCEEAHSNIWIGTFSAGLDRWHSGAAEHFSLSAATNRDAFFPPARTRKAACG